MADAKGIRQVGHVDCAGGGQIIVDRGIAYIGHIDAPNGTSIVDVKDPKHPKRLAELSIAPGLHSHKVRVGNGIMVINRERTGPENPQEMGGLDIFDIETPGNPKLITRWETPGKGVHRFDFDGRYFYGSPTVEGYRGNIMLILDLADPTRPEEVGRWWMEGQWTAGGEQPSWERSAHRCHHPLRRGDRLYTSYWHGGFVILDIADMSKPKLISHLDWSPPFPSPTHSAVPLPFDLEGHQFLLVADEDVQPLFPGPPAMLWMVDITKEDRPVPVASHQLAHLDGSPQPKQTGCHQPVEKVTSPEVPVAWFANGLRIIDISRPHATREIAHYVPDPAPGAKRPASNDVFLDERGLIYLLDRFGGLEIVERQ
jgi:hypothetical protein